MELRNPEIVLPAPEDSGGKIIVGYPAGGCALNGLEYLLDDCGDPVTFDSVEEAKEFLREHGVTEEELDELVFENLEDAEI